jgi:hypothetical protein
MSDDSDDGFRFAPDGTLLDDEDGGGGGGDGRSTGGWLGLGVLAVVGLGLAFFLRPWLHGIVMGLYTTPELVIAAVVAGVVFVVVRGRVPGQAARSFAFAAGTVALFGAVVIGSTYGAAALGQITVADASDRAELPTADADHPRIVPRAVANRYASNSLQTSRFKATGGDVTVVDNTTYWSYALSPDGTRNRYLEKQNGTVLVNMEQQGKSVRVVEGEMDAGIGMSVTDAYTWRLHKSGPYLVDYHDPFMVVEDGQQYIAVPYTEPVFGFRLPVPFTRPSWGGVALIDADGEIQHLSPEEAQANEVLRNQRLYPFELARQQVAATRYRNGIVNTLPVVGSHREEIELAPLPGEGNRQPFLTRTDEGLTYFVAAEPFGETQGLREVWTVDPRTGKFERFRTGDGSTLVGPRKAADFVRQAARTTDWSRFDPTEPIPTVIDGSLYWQLRVVPNDASGISYVAFVNADSTDVLEAETTDEITKIVRGETDALDNATGDGAGEQREPDIVIEKRNEDGEVVERLLVFDNESVTIQRGNATTNTTDTG